MKSLYLAPLQGYTNYIFRNLHNKYFGGIDKYFSPYLRFEPKKEYKKSTFNDLKPENNEHINFIPQVLGSNIQQFIELAQLFKSWGYKEMNWNLGCPYPMVTKSGLGSAMLQNATEISQILESVLPKIDISISIKCRLGFTNDNDIFNVITELNKFKLNEIIVHARNAKQMYGGNPNYQIFKQIIGLSKNKLAFNGDILQIQNIEYLTKLFNDDIDTFMIGRGLLKNPFLASEINGKVLLQPEKLKILKNFHNELFDKYQQKLEPSHLLTRLTSHWEYISFFFENQHKTFKKIKKSSNVNKYLTSVNEVFNNS